MNHPSPTQRNYFFLSKNGIVFTRNHFLMVANHRYRVARMHESLRLMAPKNLNIESIEEWEDGKNNHNFFRGIIFIFSSSSLSLCALSELLCKLSKIVPAQSSPSFLGASGQCISHLWRRGASWWRVDDDGPSKLELVLGMSLWAFQHPFCLYIIKIHCVASDQSWYFVMYFEKVPLPVGPVH